MTAERITDPDGSTQAIILYALHHMARPGVQWFSDPGDRLQVAAMRHPRGHVIAPHCHNPVIRTTEGTSEVLFVRRGRLAADFYRMDGTRLASRMLEAGDVLILLAGGHGFRCLEETELWEVKSGPYVGAADKTRLVTTGDSGGTVPAT